MAEALPYISVQPPKIESLVTPENMSRIKPAFDLNTLIEAADKNSPQALEELSMLYQYPDSHPSINQDLGKATKLLERSAKYSKDQTRSSVYTQLGCLYDQQKVQL